MRNVHFVKSFVWITWISGFLIITRILKFYKLLSETWLKLEEKGPMVWKWMKRIQCQIWFMDVHANLRLRLKWTKTVFKNTLDFTSIHPAKSWQNKVKYQIGQLKTFIEKRVNKYRQNPTIYLSWSNIHYVHSNSNFANNLQLQYLVQTAIQRNSKSSSKITS